MNEQYFQALKNKKLRKVFLSVVSVFEQNHGLHGVGVHDIDTLENATEVVALLHSLGANFYACSSIGIICTMEESAMCGGTYTEAGMRAYLFAKFTACTAAFSGKGLL